MWISVDISRYGSYPGWGGVVSLLVHDLGVVLGEAGAGAGRGRHAARHPAAVAVARRLAVCKYTLQSGAESDGKEESSIKAKINKVYLHHKQHYWL